MNDKNQDANTSAQEKQQNSRSDRDLFLGIMRFVQEYERRMGRIPKLVEPSHESGLSPGRIKDLLLEFLPEEKLEGNTAFENNLSSLILTNSKKWKSNHSVSQSVVARGELEQRAEQHKKQDS